MRQVLLVALFAIHLGCSKKENSEEGDGAVLPPPSALEVDTNVLYHDYQRAAAAADEKHLHKRLRVSGQVYGLEEAGGSYRIGIYEPPQMISGGGIRPVGSGHDRIVAAIDKAEAERDTMKRPKPGVVAVVPGYLRSEVAKLKMYDPIIVEGSCAGHKSAERDRLWVTITGARIVSARP